MSTPWLAADAAQPLRAWSSRQLDALATALAHALAQWRQAWDLPDPQARLHCEPATMRLLSSEAWQALGDAPAAVWLHRAGESSTLEQLLFDDDLPIGPIGRAVAQRCAQDAGDRLAAVLAPAGPRPAQARPPSSLGRAWSGAVQAHLPGTPGWSLLLAPEAMHAWRARAGLAVPHAPTPTVAAPLAMVGEALAAHPLTLTVTLAGCELDLRALTALQLGDVVRLQHAFDAPATVRDAQGRAVFDGYLVAQQGRKAVELVKSTTSMNSTSSGTA